MSTISKLDNNNKYNKLLDQFKEGTAVPFIQFYKLFYFISVVQYKGWPK
jgi:hypothetical protein